jgi:hypothetical protein
MIKYDIEPWPSTYKMGESLKPSKLVPNVKGRTVGAFRSTIPPCTVEPPQIHLIAARDNHPFQELITSQDRNLLVAYFDIKSMSYSTEEYLPGQDLVIPAFKIHWLINPNEDPLSFVCEYAPHPWDGDNDEPEFPNLSTLLKFVENHGLIEKLRAI